MAARNVVIGQRVSPEKVQRAKELRREQTAEEKTLWQHVRRNELAGFHFRRQQVIDGFIVDFYCHAACLVVEVDGEVHLEHKPSQLRVMGCDARHVAELSTRCWRR